MDRPCKCGDCHLCAVYAAAHGLPVKLPDRQPTLAEYLSATDATAGEKLRKKKKAQRPDDDAGLFAGAE